MRNLPNLITLVRLALVPLMAYYATAEYAIALPIFLIAAVSDFVDGYIARELKLASRLGAALDPDRRQAQHVRGDGGACLAKPPAALARRRHHRARRHHRRRACSPIVCLIGPLEIKPTRLSKVNTFIEFGVLLVVMAIAAGWIDIRAWMPMLFVIVFVTVVASGAQYVFLGTRMAVAERRKSASRPGRRTSIAAASAAAASCTPAPRAPPPAHATRLPTSSNAARERASSS